ncbi:MAG: prevent-host-death family protein [Herminiimonas sp.]|nr:prevent-host-death family protein [Herminiimonas sp.]
MAISLSNVMPVSAARARFSELAEEVKAGAEKTVTTDGECSIALIDANPPDHHSERDRIHLLLIDEASKGLDDVAAGRTKVSVQPRHLSPD